MHIDDATGHVILDRENCHGCDHSERPGQTKLFGSCKPCKGTGNGPRGGKGGCRKCHGSGKDYNVIAGWETCTSCNGMPENADLESRTGHVPTGWGQRFRFFVVRSEVSMTTVESLMGAGFWSCVDYGDAYKADDATITGWMAAKFAADRGISLCKFARPTRQVLPVDRDAIRDLPHDERIAAYAENELERWAVPLEVTWNVAILVRRNGYSVLPLWPEDAAALGIDTTPAVGQVLGAVLAGALA